MASHARSNGGDGDPLALLAAYSLPIYVGGLIAIATPLALAEVAGIVVPPAARTAVVAVSLAVMVATYVGERRGSAGDAGGSATGDGRDRPEYSLRARLAVAAAVVGVAVGVYVAAAGDVVVGLLFVLGAYFFGYLAYRGEES